MTPKANRPPIDLLVVDNDNDKTLARGLSIKLLPPEDESRGNSSSDSPPVNDTFQSFSSEFSASGSTSITTSFSFEIPLPNQTDKLGDLCDASAKFMQQPVPLHRTESRLPSLEDMLDDALLTTTVYKEVSHPFVKQLTDKLKIRDFEDRLKQMKELQNECIRDFEFGTLTKSVQEIFVETLAISIKQNVSKNVEYQRTLEDMHKAGKIDNVLQMMETGDSSFTIERWALISAALGILANISTMKSMQDMIMKHDIATILCQRRVAMCAAVSGALLDPNSCFARELIENFPRILCTFFSNLMVDRDDIRESLWNSMWPNFYWSLMYMTGYRHIERFCLLLHTHCAYLTTKKFTINEESDSSYTQQLKADFINMGLTYAQASRARYINRFLSSFPLIYGHLIILVRNKLHELTEGRRSIRHATVLGRAIKQEAVSEDWFALFQLRLLSMGDGHSIVMFCQHFLHNPYVPKLPTELEGLRGFNIPKPERGTEIVATILYALSEYSEVTTNDFGHPRDKIEEICNRPWNLIRRSFINSVIIKYLLQLFAKSLSSCDVISEKLKNHVCKVYDVGQRYEQYDVLCRPIIKTLINILQAPELRGKLKSDAYIELWGMSWLLIQDSSRSFLKFVKLKTEAEELKSEFVQKTNVYSTRDMIQVVYTIADGYPSMKKEVDIPNFKLLLMYANMYQRVDIGLEQAATLALKILAEDPVAARNLTRAKSEAF